MGAVRRLQRCRLHWSNQVRCRPGLRRVSCCFYLSHSVPAELAHLQAESVVLPMPHPGGCQVRRLYFLAERHCAVRIVRSMYYLSRRDHHCHSHSIFRWSAAHRDESDLTGTSTNRWVRRQGRSLCSMRRSRRVAALPLMMNPADALLL
jgi:hypothetical protein